MSIPFIAFNLSSSSLHLFYILILSNCLDGPFLRFSCLLGLFRPCVVNGSFPLCKCLSDESRSSTIPFSFIRPIAQYTFCYLYSLSIILLACSSSIPGRLITLTPLEFPKFHGLRLSKAIFLLKGHFYCKRKFSLLFQTIHQNFIIKCFNVSNKWMHACMRECMRACMRACVRAWCKCEVKYLFLNFFSKRVIFH